MTALAATLARTIAELERIGVPDEALATLVQRRFRGPRLVAFGRAWRLGVILLDREGRLYETTTVTRAVEPLRGVTNRSAEAEARRDVRRIAARSGFPEGETINVDPVPVGPGSGPLVLEGDEVLIRWSAHGPPRRLDAYLAERVALLADG